jgi:hypothetical protein
MSLYLYVIDPNHRERQREHVRNRRPTDSGVDLISQNTVLNVAVPYNLGKEIRTGVIAAARPT